MTGLHSILLAAGNAQRFGGSKLTAGWRGEPLLVASLAVARAAPVESVIVVTGGHRALVDAALDEAGARDGAPIRRIYCADHGLGMSASIRSGMLALPQEARGAFIFLADMPSVPTDLAARLLRSLSADHLAAAPVVAGRRSHPVLILRPLFRQFASLSGDRGGRDVLDSLGDRLATVTIDDPRAGRDVDMPSDLR